MDGRKDHLEMLRKILNLFPMKLNIEIKYQDSCNWNIEMTQEEKLLPAILLLWI